MYLALGSLDLVLLNTQEALTPLQQWHLVAIPITAPGGARVETQRHFLGNKSGWYFLTRWCSCGDPDIPLAPANYFCWLSFFKASLWSTSAQQQSWRLSGTPGQAWEQLREILKTPFCPHGNPSICPTVGLSESPMLHHYGTRSLPNTISLQEEERGHATWKVEGTWYRMLNNVPEPRLHKPSTSAAMCLLWLWGDPTLVLDLLFHSCCFLHSLHAYLHKLSVSFFSWLQIQFLLILQRPA